MNSDITEVKTCNVSSPSSALLFFFSLRRFQPQFSLLKKL